MKRLRRRTRNRVISICCTLVILLGGVFVVTGINKASYDGNVHAELLGDAINYGIVAEKVTQWEHLGTNFATKQYSWLDAFWLTESYFTQNQYNKGQAGVTLITHVDRSKPMSRQSYVRVKGDGVKPP